MALGSGDKTQNFLGDPAGYLTGTNTEGFPGVKKMLFGDPEAIKKAYDQMANLATSMTGQTRNFLSGQEQKALQFWAPLQRMFGNAYGTEGIQGPQIPQAQGGPLMNMYGGK